jgi:excisionase family DNA binding protein
MSRNGTFPDVLTLAEAARYLRVPQAAIRKRAQSGDIPGRRFDKDWRFLKSALEQWLVQPTSNSGLLSMAGAFKDDPDLPEIVRQAYEARARTAVE